LRPLDNEVAVRLLLLLVMSLGVLLIAHAFFARSSEELRLTFHGVKVVSEDNVATLHELPTLIITIANFPDATVHKPPAPLAAVEPISDTTMKEPPALVIRVARVPDQTVAIARKPPAVVVQKKPEQNAAILLPRTIAARVSEQKLFPVPEPTGLGAPIDAVSDATVNEPPAPAARVTKVSEQSVATAHELLSPPIAGIATVHEPSAIIERIAKVQGEKNATALLPSARL